MYEPSLEEMEAFGHVGINSNDIYFNEIDCFMIDVGREDFATKPYLQLLGAAEIAYNTPEFFGYNVPDYYWCGNKRIYCKEKIENSDHYVVEIKVRGCGHEGSDLQRCGGWLVPIQKIPFNKIEDAKSFMFRLVLCWLKQESEK